MTAQIGHLILHSFSLISMNDHVQDYMHMARVEMQVLTYSDAKLYIHNPQARK